MAIPNTILEKKLGDTDITSRLAVPARCLDLFPAIPEGNYHVFIPVMDEAGHVWNFRLVIRKGSHRMPRIDCTDWSSYVTQNDLRKGDRITFYKENGEANEEIFRVRVSRDPMSDGSNMSQIAGSSNGGGGGNTDKKGGNRDGNGNRDNNKRGSDNGGGEMKGKNMDFMGEDPYGCKFGYHAGNENGYPVGKLQCALSKKRKKLQCAQEVQSPEPECLFNHATSMSILKPQTRRLIPITRHVL